MSRHYKMRYEEIEFPFGVVPVLVIEGWTPPSVKRKNVIAGITPFRGYRHQVTLFWQDENGVWQDNGDYGASEIDNYLSTKDEVCHRMHARMALANALSCSPVALNFILEEDWNAFHEYVRASMKFMQEHYEMYNGVPVWKREKEVTK